MASSAGEEIVVDDGASLSAAPSSALRSRGRGGSAGPAPALGERQDFSVLEGRSSMPAKRIRRERGAVPFDFSSVGSVVLTVVIAMVVMKLVVPSGVRPRIWTAEELGRYNGSSKRLPLLLSILGSVFDVSEGRKHYGPGGGYHHFTGRDASRAFVSGNFTGDGLTDSLEGLTPLQVKQINDWKIFLKKKYRYVGPLVGRFYDKRGKPLREMARVAKQVSLGEQAVMQQKADQERFPSCNSRWSEDLGGEVWCDVGYPRIADRISTGTFKGSTGTRCACFEEEFLNKDGLRLYEGCEPTAQKCQSAPPRR